MSQSSTNSRKSMSLPFSALGDCKWPHDLQKLQLQRTATPESCQGQVSFHPRTPGSLSNSGLHLLSSHGPAISARTGNRAAAECLCIRRFAQCTNGKWLNEDSVTIEARGCCRQDCHRTLQRAGPALQCLPAAAGDSNAVFRNRCIVLYALNKHYQKKRILDQLLNLCIDLDVICVSDLQRQDNQHNQLVILDSLDTLRQGDDGLQNICAPALRARADNRPASSNSSKPLPERTANGRNKTVCTFSCQYMGSAHLPLTFHSGARAHRTV